MVDGLEFLSSAILVSADLPMKSKLSLLFDLFDLDGTDKLRKEEFTILLRAVTTGINKLLTIRCNIAQTSQTFYRLRAESLVQDYYTSLPNPEMSRSEFFVWAIESHCSLYYLSCLSRKRKVTFAWGKNDRLQLGLGLHTMERRVPSPILELENLSVSKVASNESHTLFLTETGQVWVAGSGFCGILGVGDVEDRAQPALLKQLEGVHIIDIAVGVRHSAAASKSGYVYTWGAADLGQLGLAPNVREGINDPRKWSFDTKTGSYFSYVDTPTIVRSLWSCNVRAKLVSCNSFSTCILTTKGTLYTVGETTDGQCGHGQTFIGEKLLYLDPHIPRTALQVQEKFTLVEKVKDVEFAHVSCGAGHTLAVSNTGAVWSWGIGQWGRLGHNDQMTCYTPKLIQALKHQKTVQVAAGFQHSCCVASQFKLTLSSASSENKFSAFSLLGLPMGRADCWSEKQRIIHIHNTELTVDGFVSAPLLIASTPHTTHDVIDMETLILKSFEADTVQRSAIMVSRGLYTGQWLKLSTMTFDFKIVLCERCGSLLSKYGAIIVGLLEQANLFSQGQWELEDCEDRICVFELNDFVVHADKPDYNKQLSEFISQRALQCKQANAVACIVVCREGIVPGRLDFPECIQRKLQNFPVGLMPYDHGAVLAQHLKLLVEQRFKDKLPQDMQDWERYQENFTGRTYYYNSRTGLKRRAPPFLDHKVNGTLLSVETDNLLERLKSVLKTKPQVIKLLCGYLLVVISHQSWKPDVSLAHLSSISPYEEESLAECPIVQIPYEAGEELRTVCTSERKPWITIELQPYGAVYTWGMGTQGQLSLSNAAEQERAESVKSLLTRENNIFAPLPTYVPHVHDQQVTSISAGAATVSVVTSRGQVFCWGRAEAIGADIGSLVVTKSDGFGSTVKFQLKAKCVKSPVLVTQFDGIAHVKKVFSGHHHAFAVAEMPYESVFDKFQKKNF